MSDIKIFDFSEEESFETFDSKELFNFLKQEDRTMSDTATVYLAGPIESDLDKPNPHSIKWRQEITELFKQDTEVVWDVRDPTNGKRDDSNYIRTEANQHYYNPYILFRTDLKNVSESDFLIVNISNYITGFGTPFEVGFAFAKNIPIIYISSPGVIPEHPFITQSADAIVFSEEEAVNLIKFMLTEDAD